MEKPIKEPLRIADIVELFERNRFEYVLIGGVAANAHGSAMVTTDFDVAAPLTLSNIECLMKAVAAHRPRWAQTLDKRPITHTPEQLVSFKNLYIQTNLGRVDVLGSVEPIGSYDEVARRAQTVELFGVAVKVISLDDLITVKAHVGRPKDKLVEHELRAIRDKLRSGK